MAKSSLSITLVILFCGLTLASRTKILPLSTITALAPELNDGVCSSLVKTQGYACEEHLVTTKDGYVLNMQRILPRGKPGNSIPVVLQLGLFMVSGGYYKYNYRPD